MFAISYFSRFTTRYFFLLKAFALLFLTLFDFFPSKEREGRNPTPPPPTFSNKKNGKMLTHTHAKKRASALLLFVSACLLAWHKWIELDWIEFDWAACCHKESAMLGGFGFGSSIHSLFPFVFLFAQLAVQKKSKRKPHFSFAPQKKEKKKEAF
ncbi:hypothetical protein BX661DRAFT_54589 [Kickxella alabastrina]|uniref:uncharacterized protein n=1 Tax=Kickxella alabastrina TaxID=61397 RepID=UPI00221F97CB|nr:uncharacterized protein BX661DRAFT_54589 [Kickxella alabastrina]KAI7823700.1 hypothetical protein BX661DRAFT_54589 [Kickxella alabastrina]